MMTTIVQTASRPEENTSHSIPPTVLVIGKKRARDYVAPALFRIATFSRVEIKAKGTFSISTAVDVAELVKRNVENANVDSISIGTDQVVAGETMHRVSFIEIAITRRNPQVTEAHVDVEADPATIAERIAGASEIPAKKKRAAPKKKATKSRATRAKA